MGSGLLLPRDGLAWTSDCNWRSLKFLGFFSIVCCEWPQLGDGEDSEEQSRWEGLRRCIFHDSGDGDDTEGWEVLEADATVLVQARAPLMLMDTLEQ